MEEITKYYNEIVAIMNKKATVKYQGSIISPSLNNSFLKINSFKTLLFNLDTGMLSATITNQIKQETDLKVYFWDRDTPDQKINLSDLKQIIKEIENL